MDPEDIVSSVQVMWMKLTENAPQDVREKWWGVIKEKYSEPSRKYHTLKHLHKMFDHMEPHINDIENLPALLYAVFFHDLVYDVHSQENEEESVKLFQQFSSDSGLHSDPELLAKVEELILASKIHCTEEHKQEGMYGKDDIHFFLDFDLAILGSDTKEYKEYASQIAEEYNYLPTQKYNFLRSKVLQQFLQVPNIYATKAFRDNYEEKARKNIENEIKWLSEASTA